VRQDTAGDYLTRSFSILMLAIPSFWMGTLHGLPFDLVGLVARAEIRALPPGAPSRISVRWSSRPSFSAPRYPPSRRLARTMMLEVLRQDYIRTAWAKGLTERPVVMRHALRNALIPVVTLVGLQAPLLIGGAVILEQIFVIPGMGLLLLGAVGQRELPDHHYRGAGAGRGQGRTRRGLEPNVRGFSDPRPRGGLGLPAPRPMAPGVASPPWTPRTGSR